MVIPFPPLSPRKTRSLASSTSSIRPAISPSQRAARSALIFPSAMATSRIFRSRRMTWGEAIMVEGRPLTSTMVREGA